MLDDPSQPIFDLLSSAAPDAAALMAAALADPPALSGHPLQQRAQELADLAHRSPAAFWWIVDTMPQEIMAVEPYLPRLTGLFPPPDLTTCQWLRAAERAGGLMKHEL
jgi:hypothetical protein